jgi:hypothetical protein
MLENEVIDRHTAKSQGRKDYFTGVPCNRGHISLRWIRSGRCRECAVSDTQKWRKDGSSKYIKHPYKILPDREYLQQCFEYIDGKILWRKDRPSNHFSTEKGYNIYLTRYSGQEAGHPHKVNNYVEVRVADKLHKRSRIIYKMFYDFDENLQIDHMNRNPADDRIDNLRVLCHQDNNKNRGNTIDKSNGIYVEVINED